MGEGCTEGGCVEEIRRDEVDSVDSVGGSSGETVNLPTVGKELLREVVADDAGDSSDKCGAGHKDPFGRVADGDWMKFVMGAIRREGVLALVAPARFEDCFRVRCRMLDSFALEGCFFGSGEGVLRFDGGG